MLASVFGEPALVHACFAGCEAQHQQTAFAKHKTTGCRVFRECSSLRCSGSPPSLKTASQPAMQARSASERNPRCVGREVARADQSLRDVTVGVGLTMMLVGEGGACRSSHRRGGFRGNGITCPAVLMQAFLP